MRKYVSLNNHTSFSIGMALSKPSDLFSKFKELGQEAAGIADYDTMASMWDALKASKKTGVKLIPGCTFNFGNSVKSDYSKFNNLVLLAKNHTGYKNILALRKLGFDNYIINFKKAFSRIDWDLIEKHSDGVICLSADGNGYLPQMIMEDRLDDAVVAAKRFKDIFGDNFALELQPHNLQRRANPYSGDVDQRKINLALKKISEDLGIRCVVTTNSHYINKEDHDAHNLLLSISSGQTVLSAQRLYFDKRDFYVKSADEIYAYFARHKKMWGEKFIDSLFENTIELSDRCEFPNWIDPAVATGFKNQLPRFPIEDELDYDDFLKWKDTYEIKDLPDDALYYRYKSFQGLEEKIVSGEIKEEEKKEVIQSMLEEFDVFEARGFSSYMLIVRDIIQWCKKNNIATGPGRGCLTGDSPVLTENGFVNLSDVNIGDNVFTHKGNIKIVNDKFAYDIDEDGLEIFTDYSFNSIKLTNDHKLLASLAVETEKYTEAKLKGAKHLNKLKRFNYSDKKWVKAEDLSVSDRLFMPFPKRNNIKNWENFDLLKFSDFHDSYSDNDITFKEYNKNEHFIRDISINSNISKSTLQPSSYNVRRVLECNSDFFYFLGRWVGDGWLMHSASTPYNIRVAFHSNDLTGINKINKYLTSLGFNTSIHKSNNDKKSVQIIVRNKLLFKFLEHLFPDYKQKSSTKHLPINFRTLPEDKLFYLLKGLKDSEESINTTSLRLALELKEALLYLKIPCSINTITSFKCDEYSCLKSYRVIFKGIDVDKSLQNNDISGYFCKINKINKVKINKVYDISVVDDTSYLTSNYAVHNSVGGSITAYLTDIHAANPRKYGLIFSRFLNKYKNAFPDIDTDFSPSGREKIHNYIKNKYGEDHVAHVSNINRITPKVYARDLSRAFNFAGDRKESVELGNNIADSISEEDKNKSVVKVLESSPLFAEFAKQYPELSMFAASIGGQNRAWSTHAAGIVIGTSPLHETVPIRRDHHGELCLEYSKDITEDNGLVKIDTLGLETLDIIDETISIIKNIGKTPPPEPFSYEIYDEKTYDLISRGDTQCVFQLTGVAAPVCKTLKPKNIYDIALVSSLIRPAAKDIIPGFMKVRNGEPLEFIHPYLKRALTPTNGFALFEEQLMWLSMDVCGWDMHSSDNLRKMTKEKGKYPEKVEALKNSFIEDAFNNKGIDKDIGEKIWVDFVESFGGYGFNSSHAVLYSMISFQTAYLKAHYPLEFLVANLMAKLRSNSPKAKDEVIKIKEEIRSYGVKLIPPDINKSDMSYRIIDEKTLMTGLDALKYMGKDAIPEILEKRPFTSFKDFILRVDASKVRSTTIQALAASGALDSFGLDRKVMFLYCSDFKKKLQALKASLAKKVDKGKITKEESELEIQNFEYPFPEEKPWKVHELYALEEYYLGEGISGNVSERFPGFFNSKVVNFSNLAKSIKYVEHFVDDEKANRKANTHNLEHHGIPGLKGVVVSVFEFRVKKEDSPIFGQVMARFIVQDPFGNNISCIAFPELWENAKNRIEALSSGKDKFDVGIAIFFNGSFQWENENTNSFILGEILSYKPVPAMPKDRKQKSVKIPRKTKVTKKEITELSKEDLADLLEEETIFDGEAI